MPAYFADPYSSWQRGSNENRNGSAATCPKTPFDDLTQAELDDIVKETDDTPMNGSNTKHPTKTSDKGINPTTIAKHQPKHKRCTYKLNPGLTNRVFM